MSTTKKTIPATGTVSETSPAGTKGRNRGTRKSTNVSPLTKTPTSALTGEPGGEKQMAGTPFTATDPTVGTEAATRDTAVTDGNGFTTPNAGESGGANATNTAATHTPAPIDTTAQDTGIDTTAPKGNLGTRGGKPTKGTETTKVDKSSALRRFPSPAATIPSRPTETDSEVEDYQSEPPRPGREPDHERAEVV